MKSGALVGVIVQRARELLAWDRRAEMISSIVDSINQAKVPPLREPTRSLGSERAEKASARSGRDDKFKSRWLVVFGAACQ
jgi:hypothetical protein